MATIVVTDLSNVSVDGVAAGSVTDVLSNFKSVVGLRGDLLRAIQAWYAAGQQANADAHAKALADVKAKLDAATATVAEQKTQIDALGGTDLGRRLAAEKEHAAAVRAKADAEAAVVAAAARLAELKAAPAEAK